MSAVALADSDPREKLEALSTVRERLEEFGREMLTEPESTDSIRP